jgi:hypothetical protein
VLYVGFFEGPISAALLLKKTSFVTRASSNGIAAVLDCKTVGPGGLAAVLGVDPLLNEELQPRIDESKNPESSSIQDRFESNISPSW